MARATKLSDNARNLLIALLLSDSKIDQRLSKEERDTIEQLSDRRIRSLAKELGINVREILKTAKETERQEQWRHADLHPGFDDAIEFDLEIEMLGLKFTRRAKIDFKQTPEWEYYDLVKQKLYVGNWSSAMGLLIWAVPDNPGMENDPPSWVKTDLFEEGVLPQVVLDKIDEEIDKRCKIIDRKRREERGLPASKR